MLHCCFHWWSSSLPEPSNWSIKSLYKKPSSYILAVQDRFPTGSTEVYDAPNNVISSLSAIRLIWKYQQTNDKNVIAKKRRVNLSTYASWSARRESRRLIATKEKRRRGRTLLNKLFKLQSAVVPMNKNDYYFLWNSSFECFFSAISFLFDTTFLVLSYRHTETQDSCFDLIRSHQQYIPWSPPLEIEPATTEPKLYNWAISPYRSPVTLN